MILTGGKVDTQRLQKKMESIFGGSTAFVIRFRILVLVLILFTTGLAISQIKTLKIDTSNEGFLHENDPILTTYNLFRDQFGRDDMTAIAIHSDNIFTVEFLQKLQKLHNELNENVPHLWDITSLVNVRNTHGQGDVLYVDDLLTDLPKTEEELARLKELVMNNQFYRNMLISEDGKMTAIIIEIAVYAAEGESDLLSGFDDDMTGSAQTEEPAYLSDEESTKTVAAIKEIARTYDSEDFRVYVAGTPVITQTLKGFMMSDTRRFMKLSVLTIGICLFVMFRRVGGVVLPLVLVVPFCVNSMGLL